MRGITWFAAGQNDVDRVNFFGMRNFSTANSESLIKVYLLRSFFVADDVAERAFCTFQI